MEEYKLEILNEYLREVVKNNDYCCHCVLNHEGICFFASKCVKHNFDYYTDEKTLDNKE